MAGLSVSIEKKMATVKVFLLCFIALFRSIMTKYTTEYIYIKYKNTILGIWQKVHLNKGT